MIDYYSKTKKELIEIILEKDKRIAELEAKVAKLEAVVENLLRRLGLDSQTSSKPPSSDGLKKKTARR